MSANKIALNPEKQLDIPKELWMMVDHLFRSAVKQVRKVVVFFVFCFFRLISFLFCASFYPSTQFFKDSCKDTGVLCPVLCFCSFSSQDNVMIIKLPC